MPINFIRYDDDSAFRITAGATISRGQLVGINASGQAVLADADAGTPIPAVGVALDGVASGEQLGVALQGELEDTTWTWTPGDRLYVSGTAGGLTATRPSTATNLVQGAGFAKSATRVVFNLGVPALVVQAAGNSTVAFG